MSAHYRTVGPDGTPRDSDCSHYKVIRFYFRGRNRTIARGLTQAEAQAHCSDPETSSTTATSAEARARTKRMGPWFDGYDHE